MRFLLMSGSYLWFCDARYTLNTLLLHIQWCVSYAYRTHRTNVSKLCTTSNCGSKWIPLPMFQDIEEMERHDGDGPCSSSSLKQTTGELLTCGPADQQPPQLQLPQMKTSTFKKLKKRLRSKVKGGASKKKSNSPFLEPSHRHSAVDMNGEFTWLLSPIFFTFTFE